MRRLLTLAVFCVTVAVLFFIYLPATKQTDVKSYRFEIIEGKRIATDDKNVYVLKIKGDLETPQISRIGASSGWNLTLNRNLRVLNVLKCFNGKIYAAGVDIVKIRDGEIEWIKNLVAKKVSYEGTRENPVPVYYEDVLNVFDIESDGKYLYINTEYGIVKTDAELNVIWAVELGKLNDAIAVSDGIYATRGNQIVKLSKDGEIEWAISLKSGEMIKKKLEIPEEKRKAAEKEGKIISEFYEVDRYQIDLYAVYADDYVYVAGLANDRLNDRNYPFLAKLSSDGKIVWAKIVNTTYPGSTYELEGKIVKDETFVAWFSNYILFLFDEDGRIPDFYIMKGAIEDVALMNNTVYIAAFPIQVERIEDQKLVVEKREAKMEKISAVSIPVNIKAVKQKLKVKEVESYSKEKSP